ncbi:MAG: hypothetical protein RL477_1531 [Pseudomonadota bacterium]
MAVKRGSGNVFLDIGFDRFEAEELAVKADLIAMVADAIARRGLTQTAAAKLCGTHQTSLSKVLSGKLDSVTIDQLAKWIVALGGDVRITASAPRARARRQGSLTFDAARG